MEAEPAPNKRLVIGRCDRMAAEQARRKEAHRLLGIVAVGEDPAAAAAHKEAANAAAQAGLRGVHEGQSQAQGEHERSATAIGSSGLSRDWLGAFRSTPSRASDVEDRFNRITEHHGWATANQCISLLRSVYRRPCVDYEGLANPVDLWLAGGGRFHHKPRRKIPPPAEVLPRWRKGIEAVVSNPALRDVFWFGMFIRHAARRGASRSSGTG